MCLSPVPAPASSTITAAKAKILTVLIDSYSIGVCNSKYRNTYIRFHSGGKEYPLISRLLTAGEYSPFH